MKFTCLQTNLKQGLLIASHISGKNINLPILANVLFKINDNEIKLLATNLEIAIIHSIRGKVDEPGDFTADGKIITEYVNLLPSEKVEIGTDEDESVIKLECDKHKSKIKIGNAKEFPLVPEIVKDMEFAFDADDFKNALSQVIFAASNNETRIELSGALLDFKNDHLCLAATDSYRLAEKKLAYATGQVNNFGKVIVPVKTLQEVTRIIGIIKDSGELESENIIKVYVSESQIMFAFKNTEIISKIINGNYPDYQPIIPDSAKTEVFVDKDAFTKNIKAAAVFSGNGTNDVALVVDATKGKIFISAASGVSGESMIEMDAEISGESNDVVINHKYLLDGLNNISSHRISLSLVNGNTPCLLKPENDKTYLYVAMPIRQ